MNLLPNGCSYSDLSIYPKNWEKGPQSLLKKAWRIDYYFYDPKFSSQLKHGRYPVRIKGVNKLNNLDERRAAIKALRDAEIDLLTKQGYNPITKVITPFPEAAAAVSEIGPDMLLVPALNFALKHKKCVKSTKVDLKSVITHTEIAAAQLGFLLFPIKDVTRSHMKQLLDQLEINKGAKWSDNTYNYFRAHWMMLWRVLEEYEAVPDCDVIEKIKKRPKLEKKRKVLTPEQRQKIDRHLRASNYRFWLAMHIFFHSGIRRTEMCHLKGKDVNLTNQSTLVTILKGGRPSVVEKPIKTIVLPFWEQALAGCGPEDYIFSEGLEPGATSIDPDQLTRRWKRWVKDKYPDEDIADFYSLKHSNSDEMAELLSIEDAAKLNSHRSVKTAKIYAQNEDTRQRNRIKSVGNAFVSEDKIRTKPIATEPGASKYCQPSAMPLLISIKPALPRQTG